MIEVVNLPVFMVCGHEEGLKMGNNGIFFLDLLELGRYSEKMLSKVKRSSIKKNRRCYVTQARGDIFKC